MTEPILPPKQVTYPVFNWTVTPDGALVLLIITYGLEQLVFPMSRDAAAQLGKTLSAPSLHLANGTELPS